MKTIELKLNANQEYYLKNVLHSEMAKYFDRVAHAASHGQEYTDVRGESLGTVLDQIEKE